MKLSSVAVVLFLLAAAAFGQSKSNDAIARQIKTLKADKSITLTYDAAADTTKIMVVAENFGQEQQKAAGIDAINFGMAFFYPGQSLAASPEEIALTFWVLNKKPKFASSHKWTTATLDLGDARYAARASEEMEYLNFKVSREDLTKIAASDGKFRLGAADLQFSAEHLRIFNAILAISDVP